MVVVAVAGGTGAVGRTIVKALIDSNNHQVFVLSRSVSCSTRDKYSSIDIYKSTAGTSPTRHLAIDYKNVKQIESVLRKNAIQVVVSALVLLDANVANAQINLIRAAAKSTVTKFFVPSEYHLNFNVPVA